MTPIKVLLIHRRSDVYRHLTGWWSYPVNEFEWQVHRVPVEFEVDMNQIEYQPDLIVVDDWIFGPVRNRKVPLAYVIVDSARSHAQLERNLKQAQQADLVLIDSDDLSKFGNYPYQVRRFAHAVNDELFHPRDKVYDVAFLCWPTDERRVVQRWCKEICDGHHWSFVSGTFDWKDYALFLSSAKVVVHKAHVTAARSWRVFDVMAARGCLLSTPLPTVSGDGLVENTHYRIYHDRSDLERQLIGLLDDECWRELAENGYQHVLANHTWKTRAAQLRETLTEVFQWH